MDIKRYAAPSSHVWQGRVDSTVNYDAFRWHQWVRTLDLTNPIIPLDEQLLGIAFLGFCSDEGVRRNKGRGGASNGPASIRKELSNLPCWFDEAVCLFDAGDIRCDDGNLEASQQALADAVALLLAAGLFPIVLGGGHEIAYGHFNGLRQYLSSRGDSTAPGIINFDAHLDLRPYPEGGSSGTMFRQIADDCLRSEETFSYLCLGVQRYGNTVDLFKTADALGVRTILSKDLAEQTAWEILDTVEDFMKPLPHLYVTICSDVFSSAFAPGVSATQPVGLDPELCLRLLKQIFRTGKVMGFDIAEVSPRFDQDNTTANLAKVLIFAVVNALATERGLAREI